MFEIKYLFIIILIGILIYLVYNLYSYQTKEFNKLKENIEFSIEDQCQNLFDDIEDLLDKRIGECNRKIKDLYSLQNKMNEVNKMNNQSIINQFNHFDDGIEDIDENKNQIFNSVDNSNNLNNKETCFIKINDVKDKEAFYMSTENKNNSNTYKTSKTSKSSKSPNKLKKNKSYSSEKNKDSDNSILLEISNNYVKSNLINNPFTNPAFILLNESSNIIKNSLFNINKDNNTTTSKSQDYLLKEDNIIEISGKSYTSDISNSSNKKSYKSNKSSILNNSEQSESISENELLKTTLFNNLKKSKVIEIN